MGKRVTPVILSILVAVLFVFTTFGPHGILHLQEINNEVSSLQSKNSSLEREIASLTHQVNEMKFSKHTLEKKAREEHGLSRPGEMVYIFSQNEKASRP